MCCVLVVIDLFIDSSLCTLQGLSSGRLLFKHRGSHSSPHCIDTRNNFIKRPKDGSKSTVSLGHRGNVVREDT